MNSFRKRKKEQTIEDVKAYRNVRFVQAQALAEKNEDEAYDWLDAEIAATRVRREAILAEDIDYDVHRILVNSISTKSMVRAILRGRILILAMP